MNIKIKDRCLYSSKHNNWLIIIKQQNEYLVYCYDITEKNTVWIEMF